MLFRIACAVFSVAVPLAALGHHSTAVNFNRDSIISVKGVITEYRFQNPHVQILMDVTNEDGETEAWMVELAAKNQFVRSGWVGDEFEAGQIITVFGRERSSRVAICWLDEPVAAPEERRSFRPTVSIDAPQPRGC